MSCDWTYSDEPFAHWIGDGMFPPSLITAANVEWPIDTWPHWHVYADEYANKRATKDIDRLPTAARHLFDCLCTLDVAAITGVSDLFPDWSAYGAGLHGMAEGGYLGWHLDSEQHPATGWLRRMSCCIYVSDWSPGDGGELLLRSGQGEQPVVVEPRRNRVVIFDCGPQSYHSVAPVTACHGRRSIAAFFWRLPADGTRLEATRTRARFDP